MKTLITSLTAGVVPRIGAPYIAIGREDEIRSLLENLDEVHGLFQSDLKNFIISREFAQTPTLGSDFLTIDSEDLNNTFYVEDDSDKIIGEIYHDISMKRPVPLRGIPAIE